jgi:hypothetical protein
MLAHSTIIVGTKEEVQENTNIGEFEVNFQGSHSHTPELVRVLIFESVLYCMCLKNTAYPGGN